MQALSANVDGILGICREGCPKSEKNKGKREQFSLALLESFSISCIFPIEDLYQKYWEKYDFWRKESDYAGENCSLLCF